MREKATKVTEKRAISAMRYDSKAFFRYSNRLNKTQQIGPLKENDKGISDKTAIANLLQKQYKSVFTQPIFEENISDITKYSYENIQGHLVDIKVTEDLILGVINQMPGNSAAGKDGIRSSYLKKAKYGIAPALVNLFRAALDDHMDIEDPHESVIIPILKPNKPKEQPASYRPIALCSQIIKVLEKLVINEITNHLEQKEMHDNQQFGFTKKNRLNNSL